jgi:GTPase SAR1 family protein
VIVIGDECVGKTSVLKRLILNTFKTNYLYTIGVDFCTKRFKMFDKELKMRMSVSEFGVSHVHGYLVLTSVRSLPANFGTFPDGVGDSVFHIGLFPINPCMYARLMF